MAVTETRYNLISCDFAPNDTAVDRFLFPLLQRWLEKNHLAKLDARQRAVDIYMTPYDQRFFANKAPVVAAVWKGYHPNEAKYIAAHNDAVNFWFVPSPNALPSLFYFLGTQNEQYTPRISMMYKSFDEFNEAAIDIPRSAKKWKPHNDTVRAQVGKMLMHRVSLWYDYDGDPYHQQKVKTFLRLYSKLVAACKAQETEMVQIQFDLLTERTLPFSCVEEEIDDTLVQINVINDVRSFNNMAVNYLSFDNNPTSYDPLLTALAPCCKIISPPRMDLLGISYALMPPALINALEVMLRPGSPGPDALLNGFAKSYEELLQGLLLYVNKDEENKG